MRPFLISVYCLIPLFYSCSSAAPQRNVASKIPVSILNQPVPEAQAFSGWKNNEKEQTDFLHFEDLNPVSVQCEKSEVFPTHPQMDQKKYFNAKYGSYNHFKISAESDLCLIKTRSKNSKGARTCLKADIMNYVIISDLYEDHCGNFYRGYKELLFERSNENMGTLFSPGRSMIPDPNAVVEGEYLYGPTYVMDSKDFYFFTEITDQEQKAIRAGKIQAENLGLRWDPQAKTFQRFR